MKLVRYGPLHKEKPGLMGPDGQLRDLTTMLDDVTPANLSPFKLAQLKAINLNDLPVVDGEPRFGMPVNGITNIIGVGLNYRGHARETKQAVPGEPTIFSKHTSSLSGPYEPIRLPPDSEKTDMEVELGVVIGQTLKNADAKKAAGAVAGYLTVLDMSERDIQIASESQYMKGKSFETFCPIGPWLVTPDEIPNEQNLDLWSIHNGEQRQKASTEQMVFPVMDIISHLSHFMTLIPGDLIITGTPAGTGLGSGEFLKSGDVIRAGIESLGEQTHEIF